jgi:hypothetical protein
MDFEMIFELFRNYEKSADHCAFSDSQETTANAGLLPRQNVAVVVIIDVF